jgi:hypothetical protein
MDTLNDNAAAPISQAWSEAQEIEIAACFEDLEAKERTALRLALRRNGYRPIPAKGKAPHLRRWQTVHATEAQIHRWEIERPGETNTGAVCGELVVLDMDVLHRAASRRVVALAHTMLPKTPLRRVGKAPKVAWCYRIETRLAKMKTAVPLPGDPKAKVEILLHGQQVIFDGIHPETGKPYRWEDKTPLQVPLAELPLVTEAELRAFLAAVEAILREIAAQPPKTQQVAVALAEDAPDTIGADEVVEHTLEYLRELLERIPAEARADYKTWITGGMVVHHETDGSSEGFGVWDEWSMAAGNYGGTEARWESFGRHTGDPVRIGTLVKMTKNWDTEASKAKALEAPAPDAALGAFLSADHWMIRKLEPPEPLLGDVVTNTTRMFIGGATGIGKSQLEHFWFTRMHSQSWRGSYGTRWG